MFLQDLENQMHIAEQRRRTLLKDFHDTWSSNRDCKAPASPFFLVSHFCFLPWPSLGAVTLTSPYASLHSLISFFLSVSPSSHSYNAAGSQNGTIVSPLPHPHLHVLASEHHIHHGYTCRIVSELIVKVNFFWGLICLKIVGMPISHMRSWRQPVAC